MHKSLKDKQGGAAVVFTVDVEQDCPPFRNTTLGVSEGLPKLLDLLNRENVVGTFFVTGEIARRFPDAVGAIASAGHEVGCHGDSHRRFTEMTAEEARQEISASLSALRRICDVRAFRAPNLSLPKRFLAILREEGIAIDSSQARYKMLSPVLGVEDGVFRVPVSMTSSVLRIRRWIRNPILSALRHPIVLFVHPWEFVDWRRSDLRIDCRFATGEPALRALKSAIAFLRRRGTFSTMGEFFDGQG